jgi:hypothetical protein
MKHSLLALICSLLSIVGLSQNGGQNSENNILKITYVGWLNGEHKVKLQNKLNCEVVATYNFDGVTTDVTIPALTTIMLIKAAPQSSVLNAKAKRRSGATCISQPDNGWVETFTVQTLPIKFKSVSGKRVDDSTIEVIFESEEDYDLSYYNIKISTDGVNYRSVGIIFPDGIVSTKTYSIKVKIK